MPRDQLIDHPVDHVSDDRLSRSRLILSIANELVGKTDGKWHATGSCVAVTGKWGTGKSTLLNFVANYLNALDGIIVVRFQPWLVAKETDIIDAYLHEIARVIGRDALETAKALANEMDRYRTAIAGVADAAFLGSGLIAKFIPRFRKSELAERRKKLKAKLASFPGAIVVVIDELDRVEAGDIREVAKFIKSVADLPNISYLIAYDFLRVRHILNIAGDPQSGEEYLKKIVQLNVPLRGMFDYEMMSQLESGIGTATVVELAADKERWDQALYLCDSFMETPRDIKRVISNFSLLHRSVGNEVDKIDMFCYAVLGASSMAVLQAVHDNVDKIVVDPGRYDVDFISELMQDRDREKGILQRLSLDAEEFIPYEKLLNFLFPRDRSRESLSKFGRILERKNLLSLIFLGNPPFRVSRQMVVEFWRTASLAKLERLESKRILSDFFAQVEKLLDELPSECDAYAMEIILSFLSAGDFEALAKKREHVETIRWMLVRLANRSADAKQRALQLWDSAIAQNDLLLAATLIRHHAFAFGLVQDEQARGGDVILPEADFQARYDAEIQRFVDEIMAGAWLNGKSGADPFYAVLQAGRWTPELRDATEAFLNADQSNVSRFCAVFVPPGYLFDKGTIEGFVSEELLMQRLGEQQEEDQFLAGCRSRMLSLLQGKNWREVDDGEEDAEG